MFFRSMRSFPLVTRKMSSTQLSDQGCRISLQAKKSQNQSGELQEGFLDKATRAAAVRGSLTTGGKAMSQEILTISAPQVTTSRVLCLPLPHARNGRRHQQKLSRKTCAIAPAGPFSDYTVLHATTRTGPPKLPSQARSTLSGRSHTAPYYLSGAVNVLLTGRGVQASWPERGISASMQPRVQPNASSSLSAQPSVPCAHG